MKLYNLEKLQKSLADETQNSIPAELNIPLPSSPSHVSFTSSGEFLVVVLINGTLCTFETMKIKEKQTEPKSKTDLSNGTVKAIQCNPGENEMLVAVLFDNKQICMVDIQEPWLSSEPFTKQAVSCCWSKKGKQIAVGLETGDIIQYTPTGVEKKRIAAPEDAGGCEVQSLYWIETRLFLASYKKPESEHEYQFYLVRVASGSQSPVYQTIMDPTPPFGKMDRYGAHFFVRMESWPPSISQAILICYTASTDVGILVENSDKNEWEVWVVADETKKLVLPYSKESESDTSPTGMAIDTSASGAPLLFILADDGQIGAWEVKYEPIETAVPYPHLKIAGNTQTNAAQDLVANSAKEEVSPQKDQNIHNTMSVVPDGGSSKPLFQQKAVEETKPPVSSGPTSGSGFAAFASSQPSVFGDKSTLAQGGTGFGAFMGSNGSTTSKDSIEQKKSPFANPQSVPAFGQPSTTGSVPAFGQPATLGSSSAFGQPATLGSSSAFGKVSSPSGTSTFGGASAFGQPSTLGGASAFGQPSTLGGASAFGQPSTLGGASAFGKVSSPGGTSTFGGASAFGKVSSPSGTSTVGGASAFGQPSKLGGASAFGQPSTLGGASAFGQPSTLGGASAFGKVSTLGGTSTVGGASAFGQPSTLGGTSGFGQASALGNTSAFGKSSSLGSASAFGQQSSLGKASAFGQFSSSGTTSAFGNVSTKSTGSTFGSQASTKSIGESTFAQASAKETSLPLSKATTSAFSETPNTTVFSQNTEQKKPLSVFQQSPNNKSVFSQANKIQEPTKQFFFSAPLEDSDADSDGRSQADSEDLSQNNDDVSSWEEVGSQTSGGDANPLFSNLGVSKLALSLPEQKTQVNPPQGFEKLEAEGKNGEKPNLETQVKTSSSLFPPEPPVCVRSPESHPSSPEESNISFKFEQEEGYSDDDDDDDDEEEEEEEEEEEKEEEEEDYDDDDDDDDDEEEEEEEEEEFKFEPESPIKEPEYKGETIKDIIPLHSYKVGVVDGTVMIPFY